MTVFETPKGFYCNNKQCRFAVWKDNRFLVSKGIHLDAQLMKKLLTDGQVFMKGLYSARTGKQYDATLVMLCFENGAAGFRLEFGGNP